MIPLSIMGGTKVTKCYINISSDLKKKKPSFSILLQSQTTLFAIMDKF